MKTLRETLGLSMPAFGRKLGYSRDVIANIEYGRVEPKEVLLDHVCDIYGVNKDWLYDGTGPMFAEDAGDEKVREAAEIFRSLSFDLRELALSQLKSLQKLMKKKESAPSTPSGTEESLDTIRLMAAMLDTQDFDDYENELEKPPAIGQRIQALMDEKQVSADQLSEKAGLSPEEIAAILDCKKIARRDTLIAIGLGLSLDVDDVQRLLAASNMPALYAKNRRDAACIFACMKKLSVKELNELLAGLEETTF